MTLTVRSHRLLKRAPHASLLRRRAFGCSATLPQAEHMSARESADLSLSVQAILADQQASSQSRPSAAEVIGVPFSCGQPRKGTEAGPKLHRDRGLIQMLEDSAEFDAVHDYGNLDVEPASTTDHQSFDSNGRVIKNAHAVSQANRKLFEASSAAFASGKLPIAIGGDHSMATGTVAAALKHNPDVGVIWVDAHADIHTPETSPSMNMHGMPISWLMGLADPGSIPGFQWLTDANIPVLRPERLVYVGLRDVDAPERVTIKNMGITAYTMHDIEELGIAKVMQMALDQLLVDESSTLHVSYDIDAVDPFSAPATGTDVPGGLTYREANYVCEALHKSGAVRSLDMVEVNPELGGGSGPDAAEKTADMGNALVTKMLGAKLL